MQVAYIMEARQEDKTKSKVVYNLGLFVNIWKRPRRCCFLPFPAKRLFTFGKKDSILKENRAEAPERGTNMNRNMLTIRILHHEEQPVSMGPGASIFFGLRGECTVATANGAYPLLPSEVYVVPPLTLYRVGCPENAGVLQMTLAPGLLQRAGWPERLALDCWLRRDGLQNAAELEVRQRCAAAFRAFFQQQGGAPRDGEALALAKLLRERFAVPDAPQAGAGTEALRLLERAMGRIRTQVREPLSLGGLAASLFVSESYLSRLFRKHLRMTFTEYLTSVRLEHAVQELRGGTSVTDTAYRSGFPSTNAFIEAFKRAYGTTPGRCRRQRGEPGGTARQEDAAEWVQELLQYDTGAPENSPGTQAAVGRVRVAGCGGGAPLRRSWEQLVNIGYARDGLIGAVQGQLRRAKEELGFTWLRFHGIFNDDMRIYQQDADGSPWYNFAYADLLFDFILSIGLTPYVELGFMPSRLAKRRYSPFDRQDVIISTCNDPEKWEALLQASIAHWIERYGLAEVLKWRFTLFSLNYAMVLDQNLAYEEYLGLYLLTYRALKGLAPRLQLGAGGCFPSVALDPDGLPRLLADLCAAGCTPDFVTVQCYPHENSVQDSEFLHFTSSQLSAPSVLSKDEDFTLHFLEKLHALLDGLGLGGCPVVVEEWNSTLWQRDLSGDTCYKAAWLVKNALSACGQAEMLGYWQLTDFLEEWMVPEGVFHGGYGLFTMGGIPKAAYQALRLLRRAGEEKVGAGEGWFVSRTGDTLQIFLYHYCHYDALYRYRYRKLSDPRNAYKVFQPRGALEVTLELSGLSPGVYREERWSVSRTAGSAYDKWLEMGVPGVMRPEDLRYLAETSQPARRIRDRDTAGTLRIEASLEPHEVQLILLEKRDQ